MKNSIKMIITDLDGTLLRDDKTVSERNKLALSRCRELGIKVIFATGRAYRTKIVPQNWFDGYARCNGAYACAGETEIYRRTISDNDRRYILDVCNQRKITIEPRNDEEIYLPDIKPEDAEYLTSILPRDLYLLVYKENFGQIMHTEATKSKAIEALARYYAINQSETVAFGDDINDKDLIDWAGTGVAMGNALNEIKAIANEVCLSNEEDGVAIWIENNVFAL